VSERLPAGDVHGTIRSNAPVTLVVSARVRSVRGRGADRTLTDAEVQDAVGAIVTALEITHGAVLRGKS